LSGASHHTNFIKESKAKSIEAMKADVRRIIVEIEGRGEYPTVEYILSLIDSPFAEKPWIEAKVIREVKHELNSGDCQLLLIGTNFPKDGEPEVFELKTEEIALG
jgi:hypothetical protein